MRTNESTWETVILVRFIWVVIGVQLLTSWDVGTDLYVQKAVTPSQPISSIEAIRETVRAALGQNMIVDEGGQFSADNYFS